MMNEMQTIPSAVFDVCLTRLRTDHLHQPSKVTYRERPTSRRGGTQKKKKKKKKRGKKVFPSFHHETLLLACCNHANMASKVGPRLLSHLTRQARVTPLPTPQATFSRFQTSIIRRRTPPLRCYAHQIPRPSQQQQQQSASRPTPQRRDDIPLDKEPLYTHPRPAPPRPRSPPPSADDPLSKSSSSSSSSSSSPASPAYYQLSFTCVPCDHRSHHNISRQGYHHGSVLITCPNCRNRHVISDHLNIFGDRDVTVEDLVKEKGQLVKRGSLGEDGDVEFWPDNYEEEGPSRTKYQQ